MFLFAVGQALKDAPDREIFGYFSCVSEKYEKGKGTVVTPDTIRASSILKEVQALSLYSRQDCLAYIGTSCGLIYCPKRENIVLLEFIVLTLLLPFVINKENTFYLLWRDWKTRVILL